MGLLDRLRRNGKNEVNQKESVHVAQCKKGYEVVEEYFVHKPIARIKIVKSPKLGEGLHYFAVETPLNEEEKDSFGKIMGILSKEMEPPTDDEMTPEEYVLDQAEMVAEKYHRALGGHSEAGWKKIFYYVVRELIGYGPLQAIMLDPNIEDISNNGVNNPIYAWHRKYESIPTNITFVDEQAAYVDLNHD